MIHACSSYSCICICMLMHVLHILAFISYLLGYPGCINIVFKKYILILSQFEWIRFWRVSSKLFGYIPSCMPKDGEKHAIGGNGIFGKNFIFETSSWDIFWTKF